MQIVYLIYPVAGTGREIPTISLILLAAIYSIQALMFIMRQKWDMIGWVLFYITTIPAFSLFLPLYSFWRMGDFLWDQTHVVLGESGKKLIVHDEGKLDPKAPVEAGATTETSESIHSPVTVIIQRPMWQGSASRGAVMSPASFGLSFLRIPLFDSFYAGLSPCTLAQQCIHSDIYILLLCRLRRPPRLYHAG
jgi:hypothetical protein